MTISTTPILGDNFIWRYSGFTRQTFVKQNKSIIRFPFLERLPFEWFKNARQNSPFLENLILSYESIGTSLYLLQLVLETFSMRIPNRTTILYDLAHQSFISCFLNILGGSPQEALVQILVIWVFHFKSFVSVTRRYLMLSTVSNTVPSRMWM